VTEREQSIAQIRALTAEQTTLEQQAEQLGAGPRLLDVRRKLEEVTEQLRRAHHRAQLVL
jgi:hypothetical protein